MGVGNAPDAARAALADAGYANCGGVPEVLDLAAPPDLVPLAEALVGQWAAALNCSAELFRIVPTDAGAVLAAARGLIDAENDVRPALWLVAWTPDAPDANNGAADAFDCRYGYFYSGLPCGPTDALAAWAGTYNGADRARHLRQPGSAPLRAGGIGSGRAAGQGRPRSWPSGQG